MEGICACRVCACRVCAWEDIIGWICACRVCAWGDPIKPKSSGEEDWCVSSVNISTFEFFFLSSRGLSDCEILSKIICGCEMIALKWIFWLLYDVKSCKSSLRCIDTRSKPTESIVSEYFGTFVISFFVGGFDDNPTSSSRLIEIVFVICVAGSNCDSSFNDESICGIVSANPIGTLDATNNKITTKERNFN